MSSYWLNLITLDILVKLSLWNKYIFLRKLEYKLSPRQKKIAEFFFQKPEGEFYQLSLHTESICGFMGIFSGFNVCICL